MVASSKRVALMLGASFFVVLLGVATLSLAQTAIATVPVGGSPRGVAVNSSSNRIYVTNVASDTVSVVDGGANAVIATVPLSATIAPTAAAVNPTTNRVYVANALGNSVSVIDATSNAVIATVGVGIRPVAVAVNATTNRIYVANRESGNVTVIDGASNATLATISMTGGGPLDVAVNALTNRVYVANSGTNNVTVIDGASNAVILSVAIGNLPVGAAVNPTTNRIYVSVATASVAVIDGSSNTVVASIPVGANPLGVAANPTTNRVYVANQNNNNVSVIDAAANTVVATVNVGGTPQGLAVNPSTSRVYVANSADDSVSVIQDAVPPAPTATATPPPSPISTWFFAEGSTQPPFDTWFLVENPNAQEATVTFTFFLQPSGTVVQSYAVGPRSRFSLFANQALPNQAFSTRVDADVRVFAERAMYVSFDGDVVTGIPAPNKLWLFAEGATVEPFHTWLLLQNPNSVATDARITYLLESGQTVSQTLVLPPNSRTSIFVNQILPNAAFSSRVESDQPIIAERAMYRFPGNAATVNSGVNGPSPSWYFAEARTTFRGLNADSFLLLQNPNATPATASITLYGTDGRTLTFAVVVSATSRLTVFLDPIFSGSFGIRVIADIPIIAERSVFFGNEPLGAYSTQGATALAGSWHFAEGETRPPFDELITVLNAQGTTMGVHVDFELENGQVIGRDFSVGANSKLEIAVDDVVPGANSATITTSLPSVVERTMYIFKGGSIGAHDTIGFAGS